MAAEGGPEGPRWEAATKVVDEDVRSVGVAIRSVACSADYIVTASSQPIVKVWSVVEAGISEARTLSILEGHGAVGSSCVQVSAPADQQLVAVCYDDGGIGLWDLRSGGMAGEFPAQIPQASKAVFVPGTHTVVSGGPSGSLCFWDLRRVGERTPEEEVPAVARAPPAATKGEGLDPAVKRRKTEVKDGQAFSDGGAVPPLAELGSPVFSLAASLDGALLACGRASGAVSVMRLDCREWARDAKAHWHPDGAKSAPVRALSFDNESTMMLSGGNDKHVCLFDAASWVRRRARDGHRAAQLQRFSAHRGWVTSLSVCPDPKLRVCATTSWDGTVKLWDFSKHALLHTYRTHSESVYDSCFSPDGGRFLATVGADAQLALYVAQHEVSRLPARMRNGVRVAKEEKGVAKLLRAKEELG